MQIFTEAHTLIKAVESHLVSDLEINIELSRFQRMIIYVAHCVKRVLWHPVIFLQMGVSEKAQGAGIWSLLMFSFMALGFWLIGNLAVATPDMILIVIWASLIVSMLLVVFAMPSTYGTSGVSQQSVNFVAKHLHDRGFVSTKEIELLKKSVKPFEERARSRVSALKWIVGVSWAAYTYVVSKSIFETQISSTSEFKSYAFMSAWLFVGTMIAYLCVSGYEAALDRLFRAVEFGCNDFCHHTEHIPSTENNLEANVGAAIKARKAG